MSSVQAFLKKLFSGDRPAYLLVLLVISSNYLRDPRYLLQPRFWAEEGSLHFAYSYSHTWLQALFNPQVGYLNFWPNLATLLATLPPLEVAPLVTTLLAFAVQMLPVLLVLFSRSPLWQGWVRKCLGVAVVLFAPLTTEVWLNTINSYVYLAVAAFFILLEETPQGQARRWVYRGLLALSGLTGTLACFLTPLFFYRAWRERQAERGGQALILAACAMLQVGLIFSIHSYGNVGQRFTLIGLTTVGSAVWTQSLGLFAAGYEQAHHWAKHLLALHTLDPYLFKLWGRSLLLAALAFFFMLSSNLPTRERIIYLGSYGLWVLFSIMFSIIPDKYDFINTGMQQRLFFAPNVILGWMLLANLRFDWVQGWHGWARRITALLAAALLCLAILWGVWSFWRPWVPASAWPDWRQEVSTWRATPGYLLRIQPEGWTVNLVKR